ncbi:non-structural protein 1 [African horse sickness virus 4]|uniref:Non-structural protein NS1 n=1 Tax=African horse sickness virus 4 TaxID=36421 RepID=A0A189RLV9_AHSV4|nr:non-structural protein 1 [African horse sickness virus 4]ALL99819.1 non-structural protein 1 [African horse sickness virus 4]
MDRFLTYFQVRGERANAVRLFGEISEQIDCSHLKRDCFVNGICARQHFKECCNIATDNGSRTNADKLVALALRALLDRQTIWTCVIKNADYVSQYADEQMEEEVNKLYDVYLQSGTREEFEGFRQRNRPSRVVMDDSCSMLSYFYIPMNQGNPAPVAKLSRWGQFGICYYDRTNVDGLIPYDEIGLAQAIDGLKDLIEGRLPVCPYTGANSRINAVLHLPLEMEVIMAVQENATQLMRRAAQDFKFITHAGWKLYPRLLRQRFAIEDATEGVIHHVMLGHLRYYDEDTSIVKYRFLNDGSLDWRTWTIPLHLMRTARLGHLQPESILVFMHKKLTCQVCFMADLAMLDTIPVVDSKIAELTGGTDVFYTRAYVHADNHKVPNVRDLMMNEVFRKIDNHWVIQKCHTTKEAITVTAIQIQRSIRGDGQWDTPMFHQSMALLTRLIVYWLTDVTERSAIFRLTCFAIFGCKPTARGRYIDWDDLGIFMKNVLDGRDLTVLEDETCFISMMRMAMLHVQRSKVVCATVLEAPLEIQQVGQIVEVPFDFMHN